MLSSSLPSPAAPTARNAVEGAGAPCYFANGDLAEGYHTCDVGSPASYCCPSGYTCSGDAPCVLTDTSRKQPSLGPRAVPRGACTEPQWNGNSCGGNFLDSEDATGEAGCDPVGDGTGEQSGCAGGNAPGGCICLSNAADVTPTEAEAQKILGRRAAPFSKSTTHQARGEEAPLHHASETVSQGTVSTEAGSPEMLPVYGSWVRTSSSEVLVPIITPVTPPSRSGAWSETATTSSGADKPSKSVTTSNPGTTTCSSTPSTETPITTTISFIASSLTHSSPYPSSSTPSSPASSTLPSAVPTFIPIFQEGGSSSPETSSPQPEAATSSLATKLGLGLGIPLVVFAAALLTACVYRRQRRLRYAQAPPFDFNTPDKAPVSAADFAVDSGRAPAAAFAFAFHGGGGGSGGSGHHNTAQQQQPYYRANSPWSEWVTGVSGQGGEWTGNRAAAWGGGGRGPYDDNEVGFVDSSLEQHQHQHQHQQRCYYNHGAARGVSVPALGPSSAPGYEDLGGSPFEGRGHAYQVPVVQVHRPQWTPAPTQGVYLEQQGQGRGSDQQPPLRNPARVSRGLSVNEEVSPLSSTGSGMPCPRVSTISGMGWETNPRVSRG